MQGRKYGREASHIMRYTPVSLVFRENLKRAVADGQQIVIDGCGYCRVLSSYQGPADQLVYQYSLLVWVVFSLFKDFSVCCSIDKVRGRGRFLGSLSELRFHMLHSIQDCTTVV